APSATRSTPASRKCLIPAAASTASSSVSACLAPSKTQAVTGSAVLALLRKKASRWGAFFVFGLLASPVQALCPAPGAVPQVQVKQVVDGDTLRLTDGRRVRLVGINAPELSGAQRTPEAFAEASRKR